MASNHNKNQKKFESIFSKAWTDESYKQKLLMHPKQTLEQAGIQTPHQNVKIVENTSSTLYLVLPEKPQGNLSERELREIAAAQAAVAADMINPEAL